MSNRKKADWQKTQEIVVADWREAKKALTRGITPALLAAMEDSFSAAVLDWRRRGNPEKLAAYFRSGRPLTAEHREDLALAVEGKFDNNTKSGRPKNRDLRSAAIDTELFLKKWRRVNRIKGINDKGHRSEMKEESARFIIAWKKYRSVDVEDILGFLSRPKSRRNS